MSLCIKADRLQNAGQQTQNSKNFLQTSDKKAAGNYPAAFLLLRIAEVKRNVLFLQKIRMRKLVKGKHAKRSSFLERKGDQPATGG